MTDLTSLFIFFFFIPILLIIPLFFIYLKNHIISSKSAPPLPPGPFAWPVIGNILNTKIETHHLPASLAGLARIHGPDLMSLRLGSQLMVVGSTPAAAREILKTHDGVLSGRSVGRSIPFRAPELNHLSVVFSFECNSHWSALRAICRTELFSGRAMETESKVGLREKKVAEMVEFLGQKEGEVVGIGKVVVATVTNILSNALFSVDLVDFEGNKGVGAVLRELTRRISELASTPNLADFFPILSRFDFQGMNKKAREIYGSFHEIWEDIVRERRRKLMVSSGDGGGGLVSNHRDFLDALLESKFSDDQINQLITELFTGGTDTSGIAIEWVMSELIKNQNTFHKLRHELDLVIGKDKIVRESHLPHLPYLQACVNEAMRLHPPGPLLLPHRALQTCQVMGYTIPKDTQVFVNMWAIGRDPEAWRNPLKFDPERFLESGLDFKGNDFEYIPFGAGRKICPGIPLAAKQISLIVASLVHLFDWILPGDMEASEMEMDEKFSTTLQKLKPLLLIPKLRK